MPRTRKTHAAQLKAQVALEAIKGHRTSSEIAQLYGVHPNLVATWKKHALELLPELFRPHDVDGASRAEDDAEKQELYRQIGQMKVELDFLKKKASLLQ